MLPGDIPHLHRGPAPAIETETRTWTYADLDDLSERFAYWYREQGLVPGDRVSLVMGSDAWLAGAYFGAFRARVVANPINNRLTAEEIAYILDHAGSKCVVVSEEYAAVVAKAIESLQRKPVVLVPADGTLPPAPSQGRGRTREKPRPRARPPCS